MDKEELYVRNANKRGLLRFSYHAYQKMFQLKITIDQVISCIENGIIVERQNGYENEDPRMVFYNGHQNSFYVVVTVSMQGELVVTVCETDFTKWRKKGEGIERII